MPARDPPRPATRPAPAGSPRKLPAIPIVRGVAPTRLASPAAEMPRPHRHRAFGALGLAETARRGASRSGPAGPERAASTRARPFSAGPVAVVWSRGSSRSAGHRSGMEALRARDRPIAVPFDRPRLDRPAPVGASRSGPSEASRSTYRPPDDSPGGVPTTGPVALAGARSSCGRSSTPRSRSTGPSRPNRSPPTRSGSSGPGPVSSDSGRGCDAVLS